jgi:hypothetical protein
MFSLRGVGCEELDHGAVGWSAVRAAQRRADGGRGGEPVGGGGGRDRGDDELLPRPGHDLGLGILPVVRRPEEQNAARAWAWIAGSKARNVSRGSTGVPQAGTVTAGIL